MQKPAAEKKDPMDFPKRKITITIEDTDLRIQLVDQCSPGCEVKVNFEGPTVQFGPNQEILNGSPSLFLYHLCMQAMKKGSSRSAFNDDELETLLRGKQPAEPADEPIDVNNPIFATDSKDYILGQWYAVCKSPETDEAVFDVMALIWREDKTQQWHARVRSRRYVDEKAHNSEDPKKVWDIAVPANVLAAGDQGTMDWFNALFEDISKKLGASTIDFTEVRGTGAAFFKMCEGKGFMHQKALKTWEAPFSLEQVDLLTRWQQTPTVHPYTCGGKRASGEDCNSNLIPTTDGWVCGRCDYTQNWAAPVPKTMFDSAAA